MRIRLLSIILIGVLWSAPANAQTTPCLPEPICEPLLMTDCGVIPSATGLGTLTCRPFAVIMDDGGPVAENCACTQTPDCGPVGVTPDGSGGYNLSCNGQCPPGSGCQVLINGTPAQAATVNTAQLDLGDEVRCDCVPLVASCPEPSGLNLCGALEGACLGEGGDCLPLCLEVQQDIFKQPLLVGVECDCVDVEKTACGPIEVIPVPMALNGPPGAEYELACLGQCPPGQLCGILIDGQPSGAQSVLLSDVAVGSQIKCGCMAEPAACPPLPICEPLANTDCELSNCCTAHGTPGCDDPGCESAVCLADMFCCEANWDGLCAGAASALCPDICHDSPSGPLACQPFSVSIIDTAVGPRPLASVCGCASGKGGACGPVDVTLEPGSGFNLSCLGNCPKGDHCLLVVNGQETGLTTIGAADVEVGDKIECECSAVDDVCPVMPICEPLALTDCLPSDCCFASGVPGCDDPTCQATVCAADPFCCDTSWDSICADEAVLHCPQLCGFNSGLVECEPFCLNIVDGPFGPRPVAQECDCVAAVDDTCGPVTTSLDPIGGFDLSCQGLCPPGTACEILINGNTTGRTHVGNADVKPGDQVKCGCANPEVCPLGDALCGNLQEIDCTAAGPGESCRARRVRVGTNIVGLPLITAEQCDCFDDGCGPVQVTPDPITGEIHLSCTGPCPIESGCRVFLDGVLTDEITVNASELVEGTAVTCACADLEPLCPLPNVGGPDPCAALQRFDCQDPEGNGFCLPIEVSVAPNGAVTVLECGCRATIDECHVVSQVGAPPTCAGSCPPGGVCVQTVISEPGADIQIRCDCEPGGAPGACCFDSDNDGIVDSCAETSVRECTGLGGSFAGEGSLCGPIGACCFDASGDGQVDTCQEMPRNCCPGTFQCLTTCSGDPNGSGLDDRCTCPEDLNGDHVVGPADLAQLIGSWGTCPVDCCSADFNGDGAVAPSDLAQLLGAWGPCD